MDYNAGASLTESVTVCQTALATLQRLGRSADADELLTEAESSTPYAAIAADTVFGTRGLLGDPGFLIVSLRDAQDRIEGEYDSIKLQRLLDKAVLNGDDIRAHAIVESAVTNGDADTVAAFKSAYPDLADAVDRLWNVAAHGITTLDVAMSWRLGALKPAPLQPLQDYEIAAAAAGQTGVGTWNVRTG